MLGFPQGPLRNTTQMWLQTSRNVLSARVRADHAQVPGVIGSTPRKQSPCYRTSPAFMGGGGPGCKHITHKFTQEVRRQKAMKQRADETVLRLQEHEGGMGERQEG